jgi:hypothetical protein
MGRSKLTIKDICTAFAEGVIEGHVGRRMIRLPFSSWTIERVLKEAVSKGYIGHSGEPYRGWLTESGISILDEQLQDRYRRAVKGRGIMGAG